MSAIINELSKIFSIKDLRKRIFFTIAIIAIYRLGDFIPTPGVNSAALSQFVKQSKDSLFGMFDLFVGGAFSQASIFSLGIMPYISSSIIIQLLTSIVPFFEKLKKEGAEGQKKINQYTRYGTLLFAGVQSMGLTTLLQNLHLPDGTPIVPNPGIAFQLLTILTMVCGTIFVMWLGEQITERGIGNGISLLIFIGIVARVPQDLLETLRLTQTDEINIISLAIFFVFYFLLIASIVFVTQGKRKIKVIYPGRTRGGYRVSKTEQYIPLSINIAGVIPIIFASSLLTFPQTIGMFLGDSEILTWINTVFGRGSIVNDLLYFVLIVFFTYFYTAIVFNPEDLANNIKKNGGYIPGWKPGKYTAEKIETILHRVTLPGSIFLGLVAVVPYHIYDALGIKTLTNIGGGTSILIMIGVALDTVMQLRNHLRMRHYELEFKQRSQRLGSAF
ncbi:MAG: preprotein translocase subunit SecY [Candidatus Coatesbacteria bacterium]|nr:preprotein translocase subunit SecY [Candidatus Coatesbacteria bacterium]